MPTYGSIKGLLTIHNNVSGITFFTCIVLACFSRLPAYNSYSESSKIPPSSAPNSPSSIAQAYVEAISRAEFDNRDSTNRRVRGGIGHRYLSAFTRSSRRSADEGYELNNYAEYTKRDDGGAPGDDKVGKRARKREWLESQDEMKFSHSIQFNAVPDWSSHYIAYSNLKKL